MSNVSVGDEKLDESGSKLETLNRKARPARGAPASGTSRVGGRFGASLTVSVTSWTRSPPRPSVARTRISYVPAAANA